MCTESSCLGPEHEDNYLELGELPCAFDDDAIAAFLQSEASDSLALSHSAAPALATSSFLTAGTHGAPFSSFSSPPAFPFSASLADPPPYTSSAMFPLSDSRPLPDYDASSSTPAPFAPHMLAPPASLQALFLSPHPSLPLSPALTAPASFLAPPQPTAAVSSSCPAPFSPPGLLDNNPTIPPFSSADIFFNALPSTAPVHPPTTASAPTIVPTPSPTTIPASTLPDAKGSLAKLVVQLPFSRSRTASKVAAVPASWPPTSHAGTAPWRGFGSRSQNRVTAYCFQVLHIAGPSNLRLLHDCSSSL